MSTVQQISSVYHHFTRWICARRDIASSEITLTTCYYLTGLSYHIILTFHDDLAGYSSLFNFRLFITLVVTLVNILVGAACFTRKCLNGVKLRAILLFLVFIILFLCDSVSL